MTSPFLPISHQQRLLLVLCLTVFCSVLNGTMFNVAVPDIAREFGLSTPQVSWVITGYITLFALGSLTFGKLADRYPVRNLILVGLLLFNSGAVVGLTSDSYLQLIVGRMIQACGGASIPALGMLTATRFVPPDRRGRVLGAIAATVAFAAGVGPMLGGLLAGFGNWRDLFLISLLTLLTLPAYTILLPREQSGRQPFDPLGALLTGLFAGSLLLLIVTPRWPVLLINGSSLLLLVGHLRRSPAPFLPLALLGNRTYLLALITAFLAIGTVFGMMFLVPILLRDLHHLPTLQIGYTIFPGALTASLMGLWAGHLADRIGSIRVVRLGLPLLACGFVLLATGTFLPALALIPILMVCYSGFAFIHASLAKTVSLTLDTSQTGIGMGLYNLVFFFSGAFGTAMASRLRVLFDHLPNLTEWGLGEAVPFSATFTCMLLTVLTAWILSRGLPADQATDIFTK